jgi:starch phosphorylase
LPTDLQPPALPAALGALAEIALDMRWTWNHENDFLWRDMDAEIWERTENPWEVLQEVPRARLAELAEDRAFLDALRHAADARREYLRAPGWYGNAHGASPIRRIAYFSMEFGLGAALPLYAGGLGVLAGDYLKTASDLGVPSVGVGLLYQQGYFRQLVDTGGAQREAYPYNDPAGLPIRPVLGPSGGRLRVRLALPGRTLEVRVWQAQVGRVPLYLLDTNDPLNSPGDRGIAGALYGGGTETRLTQEIVLGIGGWRALTALGLPVDVCHLNEGHAAFAVVERARQFAAEHGVSFWEAWWATRAGNVFTTHTAVAAGFDLFGPALIGQYLEDYVAECGISVADLLALGRIRPDADSEAFNMAHLALRGCAATNAVSRLHGVVSRRLFQPLYPRWVEREVPVTHVTNGVHMPSWDSAEADRLWTEACGKSRWLGRTEELSEAIHSLSDGALWGLRTVRSRDLTGYARARVVAQLRQRGAHADALAAVEDALDPDALTLGFARRFTDYKRPNLLLHDPERFRALLTDPRRPIQIIVAGKAHPADEAGKRQIHEWMTFVGEPSVRQRAVFLEDYDLALAQQLVQGVDVWINNPRRPWEACGTSGMKILVNGGLNLSELDGWWDEAYTPDVGWALGDGEIHAGPEWDRIEAEQLYQVLEREVVPAFYTRDERGIPRAWVERMRKSMATLTPVFNSNRMVVEYLERLYLPAARGYQERSADRAALGRELRAWEVKLVQHWDDVRFGTLEVHQEGDAWAFGVPVFLGALDPDDVRVELYAEAIGGDPMRVEMHRAEPLHDTSNGYFYRAGVPRTCPAALFTARAMPKHRSVHPPAELPLIRWQR